MTRETKIGLVVAGSFILLVGIVVASKWNGGDTPGVQEEQSQVAAVTPPKGKRESEKKVAAKKGNASKGVVPASAPNPNIQKDPLGLPPELAIKLEPGTLPPLAAPAAVGDDDALKKKQLKELVKNSGVPPIQLNADPMPMLPDFPVGDIKKPGDEKPGAPPATIEFAPLKPAPDTQADKKPIPAPKGIGPDPLDPSSFPPQAPVLKPIAKPGQESKPADNKNPLAALAPIGQLDPLQKDKTPTAKDPPPFAIKKEPVNSKPDPLNPVSPGVSIGTPKPPVIPPMNNNTGGKDPITPAIVIGAPKTNLPAVKDWSTDIYEAKAGETNFAILSLKMYGTDKYADALLAYNRSHAAGVKNGLALQSNPPILTPGQQVLKPPVGLLERDFSAVIRNPAPAPTIGSAVPAVKLSPPNPLTPIAANKAIPPVASGRVYTVQSPSGESILDIAERTLGSHREWYRISALNPQYQPQFRIPAGTQLKLP